MLLAQLASFISSARSNKNGNYFLTINVHMVTANKWSTEITNCKTYRQLFNWCKSHIVHRWETGDYCTYVETRDRRWETRDRRWNTIGGGKKMGDSKIDNFFFFFFK